MKRLSTIFLGIAETANEFSSIYSSNGFSAEITQEMLKKTLLPTASDKLLKSYSADCSMMVAKAARAISFVTMTAAVSCAQMETLPLAVKQAIELRNELNNFDPECPETWKETAFDKEFELDYFN